jgi:Phasin protein
MRDYNRKMIDMAHANAEAAFELARQLAAAKVPSDIATLWTSHARKQFEMFSEQTKELTALGQKIAGESAAPFARSFNQTFEKASWPLRLAEHEGLILAGPKHPAGLGIDEVYPRACRTGHGLISFSFPLTWIVGDPALHAQARCGTSIDKRTHRPNARG